jgi:hypothetical protein
MFGMGAFFQNLASTWEDFNLEIELACPKSEILHLKQRIDSKTALRVGDLPVALETNPEVRRQLEFDLSWVTGDKPLTIERSPFG